MPNPHFRRYPEASTLCGCSQVPLGLITKSTDGWVEKPHRVKYASADSLVTAKGKPGFILRKRTFSERYGNGSNDSPALGIVRTGGADTESWGRKLAAGTTYNVDIGVLRKEAYYR